MLEIIQAGGWLMLPIILCSIVSLAICIERFWTLRSVKVAPPGLFIDVRARVAGQQVSADYLRSLQQGSPLGRVLAAGLASHQQGREIMKETIEEVASQVVHDLERYLNVLGTIAAITPLLGLLGTVVGMIREFTALQQEGVGSAALVAGGISEALITTAAGLTVAIPTIFLHRFFHRRVDDLVISMEQQAIRLVDMMLSHATSTGYSQQGSSQ